MTTRYYDLISASVEIDESELNTKLDEITERIDGLDEPMSEDAITDLIRNTLSDEGLDASDFATRDDFDDLLARVDGLEGEDKDLDGMRSRIQTLELEDRTVLAERLTSLTERLDALVARYATERSILEERVERLEATSNTAYSFFALAGKMVALLLNGRVS
jgi:hypothetical protein